MKNHKNISQDIYQAINKAKDILIISHRNPDGDTLGCNLALSTYLRTQNKKVTSFCVDSVPDYMEFLPNSHTMTSDHRVFTKKYDIVFTVDCSTLELTNTEKLLSVIPSEYALINIDHHVSNPMFGDINLVLTDSSSTAEVLHRLLKDWHVEIDDKIATCLAVGLLTDTGGLKNPATSYQSLSVASDLVDKGANAHKIIQNTINKTDVNKLQLWGRALERLTKIDKYNIVYTWLSQIDFEECNTDESSSEGMANFLHILKDGEIIMVLKETKNGDVKGSLRTTGNKDMTKLAGLFGGGGHKKASGFNLSGKLEYANNKLIII